MRKAIWIAWSVSAVLAASAPLIRASTGTPGSGRWPIFAAVAVMLVTAIHLRRRMLAPILAITMSASSIAIGGSVGFLWMALVTHKPITFFLTGKWLFFGILLTLLLLLEVKLAEQHDVKADQPVESDEAFRQRFQTMSPEERRQAAEKLMQQADATVARVRKQLLFGLAVLAIGAVALFSTLLLAPAGTR